VTSLSLAQVPPGRRIRIAALALEGDVAAWLAAVGLHEGEEILVLRRAVFGGPIHVRTGSGGEFAVARELAAKIAIDASLEEAAE
jgi:ferrous iron transport protein A